MPTLPVDDAGTSLYYLDSGPLPNDTYVTIFILHGFSFHAPVFERLLPLASAHNLRIVAITRRGYPGSTPFSAKQLDDLIGSDVDELIRFLADRATEIAVFMDRFIQEQAIPKPSDGGDGKSGGGGIVLCGWSLGNVEGLAFAALAQDLPPDVVGRLERYLKSYVIYESFLAYPPPPSSYHPLTDPSIPASEKSSRFVSWITGYFKHPGLETKDFATGLALHPSPHRPSSSTTFSTEDVTNFIDSTGGPRSDARFLHTDSSVLVMNRIKQKVFFPPVNVWPSMRCTLIWCDETIWPVPYGLWQLEKELKEWALQMPQSRQRPFDVASIPGCNHFAHWDEPNKLLKALSSIAFAAGPKS